MSQKTVAQSAAFRLCISFADRDKWYNYSCLEDAAEALAKQVNGLVRPYVPTYVGREFRRVIRAFGGELKLELRVDYCVGGFETNARVVPAVFRVFGRRGTLIDAGRLLEIGVHRLRLRGPYLIRAVSYRGHEFVQKTSRAVSCRGHGPVPNTAKRRGGYRFHRHPATHSERTLNAFYDISEGEPAPRKARAFGALPSERDDACRCVERNWKSQFKGRKAWDR